MKKILFLLFLSLPFMASADSFAVVDRQALLESMPEYQAAMIQINEISRKYHEEYARMSADIDKKYQDYQLLQNEGMPSTIRERRIQEIQNLQKRAQQFLETAESDLLSKESELKQPLETKVNNILREIGIEENFTFIFPIDSPLFYGIEVVDITDRAISRLNEK